MSAAHGSVKKESDFGDIVDLGQEVDLQDDFQEVVVNFLVALVLRSVSLKIASQCFWWIWGLYYKTLWIRNFDSILVS